MRNDWREGLRSPDRKVRADTAQDLAFSAAPECLEELVIALGDSHSVVRMFACKALANIGDRRATMALLQTFRSDPEIFVRCNAAQALGRIGGEEAVAGLLAVLESDPDPYKRKWAAWMLGEIRDRTSRPGLDRAAASDTDADVQQKAAWSLGEIRDDELIERLLAILQQRSGDASGTLASIASERAIEQLVAGLEQFASRPEQWSSALEGFVLMLGDEREDVRIAGAKALEKLHDPRTAPALLGALKNRNFVVKETAARTLGELGVSDAIDALTLALRDESHGVRSAAVSALAKINLPHCVPGLLYAQASSHLLEMSAAILREGLLEALGHTDSRVRRIATDSIGYYSVETSLLERLTMLSRRDPDREVRKHAAAAREKFAYKLSVLGLT